MTKNLKKATGTMKKKDVYYKVPDLKSKKLEWSKIVAIAGTIDPKVKKEVEEYKEDKNLGEPYLKLGRVKKTLVLRVKDGKKHIGEWVLNEKFTPPTDLSGKDEEYAKKLKAYIESREDLHDRMQKLKTGVDKVQELAEKHVENIEKLCERIPQVHLAGETEKAQQALRLAKSQLAELKKVASEVERQQTTSEKAQDEQRKWKATSLGLDIADYNEYVDVWWKVGRIGQDIGSIANEVKAFVPAMEKLVADTELQLNGQVKSSEAVAQELKEILESITKSRKDAETFLQRIEGHQRRFEELKKQMPTLKTSDERQEAYDSDVPNRLVNSEGYVGRIVPGGKSVALQIKRFNRLKSVIPSVPNGNELTTDIMKEATLARDIFKRMKETHEKVDSLAKELEEMIGED